MNQPGSPCGAAPDLREAASASPVVRSPSRGVLVFSRPLDDQGVRRAVVDLAPILASVQPHDLIELDLHGCDFVNARGIRLLHQVDEQVRQRGGRTVLVAPRGALRRSLAVLPGSVLQGSADLQAGGCGLPGGDDAGHHDGVDP